MQLSRRRFMQFTAGGILVNAPAVVAAKHIMPVQPVRDNWPFNAITRWDLASEWSYSLVSLRDADTLQWSQVALSRDIRKIGMTVAEAVDDVQHGKAAALLDILKTFRRMGGDVHDVMVIAEPRTSHVNRGHTSAETIITEKLESGEITYQDVYAPHVKNRYR